MAAAIALYVADENGRGIVADAIRRDRLSDLAQILIFGVGLLAVFTGYRERDAAERRGRVLRAASLRRRGHGLLRRRERPHLALPRPRVVLDLALHPLCVDAHPHAGAGGRPQVPHHRRLQLGHPPLRQRARLRSDRRGGLRGDRRGRRRRRQAAARGRPRDCSSSGWHSRPPPHRSTSGRPTSTREPPPP